MILALINALVLFEKMCLLNLKSMYDVWTNGTGLVTFHVKPRKEKRPEEEAEYD